MEDIHTLQSLEAPAVLETEGWWAKYSCVASGLLSQRGSLSYDKASPQNVFSTHHPLIGREGLTRLGSSFVRGSMEKCGVH